MKIFSYLLLAVVFFCVGFFLKDHILSIIKPNDSLQVSTFNIDGYYKALDGINLEIGGQYIPSMEFRSNDKKVLVNILFVSVPLDYEIIGDHIYIKGSGEIPGYSLKIIDSNTLIGENTGIQGTYKKVDKEEIEKSNNHNSTKYSASTTKDKPSKSESKTKATQRDHNSDSDMADIETSEGSSIGSVGINHNISGRNIVAFPPREAEFKDGGTVTVRITVDKTGIITDKRIVSASSPQLRELALKKVNSILFNKNDSAPEEQFGNITFIFNTRS